MPDNPKISLIITTYNRAQLLEEALESVRASVEITPAEVEVIIVDNNSTDDTAARVSAIQKRGDFPFVSYYVHETEQGLSHARNRGLAAARGLYVVFMDDDQRIDPHYLARTERAFADTDAACVGGKIEYYNDDDLPRWLAPLIAKTGQLDLGDERMILVPQGKMLRGGNMAFRRDILKAVGGFDPEFGRRGDELLGAEEEELQDRLHRAGKVIAYCPELVQFHYLRPERYQKSYWRRHHMGLGRTMHRLDRETWRNANRLFGAPRTYWWHLAVREVPNYLRSLATFDGTKIFGNELECWSDLGRILEARQDARRD